MRIPSLLLLLLPGLLVAQDDPVIFPDRRSNNTDITRDGPNNMETVHQIHPNQAASLTFDGVAGLRGPVDPEVQLEAGQSCADWADGTRCRKACRGRGCREGAHCWQGRCKRAGRHPCSPDHPCCCGNCTKHTKHPDNAMCHGPGRKKMHNGKKGKHSKLTNKLSK